MAKAALDVITFRLTRSDRARTGPKGLLDPLSVVKDDAESASSPFTTPATASMDSNGHVGIDQASGGDENDRSIWEVGGGDSDGARADGVDDPMEILRNGSDILATMKAHPTDSRVQESGWRALIAMDTGRGDVEKFLVSGDGQERGRQMLRDCIKRHGGDSAVAGQVTAMLERLVLQGDSGECFSMKEGIRWREENEEWFVCTGEGDVRWRAYGWFRSECFNYGNTGLGCCQKAVRIACGGRCVSAVRLPKNKYGGK